MPSGDICVANIGTPWPLAYGYFRATGMKTIDYSVQPAVATSGIQPVATQIGFWDLGEGELDGPSALWINGVLQMAFAPGSTGVLMGNTLLGFQPSTNASDSVNISNTPTLSAFNFHPGVDAPLTEASTTSEVSQDYDPLWLDMGSLVTPLTYSRRAYFAIAWTPPTQDSSSTSPVLDMRGMKCRQFYADGTTSFAGFSSPPPYGTQTGYGFTTNPIWHFVDLWLRRAVKPEYAIDPIAGPDPLTADELSLFNWPSIVAAARYCDEAINITSQNPEGTPRFEGSYVFASGSTLAAMLEQVLLCCRGYWFEYAGQIYVFVDQPRPSTLLIAAEALASSSFEIDDALVNQNANRYMGQFLETGLPAVASIASISVDVTGTVLTVDTEEPNPCAVGDLISIGGVENPVFNVNVIVSSIPTVDSEPSPTQFTCTIAGGVITPGTSSTGGSLGYIQSRFSQRNPEINHMQHQLCLGQILPPGTTGTRLKRIKVNYDFASMTYDQAMRLLTYEVYRDLGLDQSPYLPPWQVTLNLWAEYVDKSQDISLGQTDPSLWRALKAQMVGDIVTLDASVFYEFAGDYEIISRTVNPMQLEVEDSTGGGFVQATSRSGGANTSLDQNSGVLQLVLRTFNRSSAIFTDVSPAANASFATVPGQLPYAGMGSSGGGEGGGGGTSVVPFTFSVSVSASMLPGGGIATASWPLFSIDYAGTVVVYGAGRRGGMASDSGPWTMYVNDATFSGRGVDFCLTSDLPTASTVVSVASFSIPDAPTSGAEVFTVDGG